MSSSPPPPYTHFPRDGTTSCMVSYCGGDDDYIVWYCSSNQQVVDPRSCSRVLRCTTSRTPYSPRAGVIAGQLRRTVAERLINFRESPRLIHHYIYCTWWDSHRLLRDTLTRVRRCCCSGVQYASGVYFFRSTEYLCLYVGLGR
jgi:hypothetical protein